MEQSSFFNQLLAIDATYLVDLVSNLKFYLIVS